MAERRDAVWNAGGSKAFDRKAVSTNRKVETPQVNLQNPAALNQTKTKSVAYQIDSATGTWEKESENFGKIWRIYDPLINNVFHPNTLRNLVLGKTIRAWRGSLGLD